MKCISKSPNAKAKPGMLGGRKREKKKEEKRKKKKGKKRERREKGRREGGEEGEKGEGKREKGEKERKKNNQSLDLENMIPDLKLFEAALREKVSDKFLKRALWHDYKSKCIYMITLMKMPGIPDFSFIKGSVAGDGKAFAEAQPLPLGHHIGRALKHLPQVFPEVRVIQYVFMPDHIHIIIEVLRPTTHHLDEIVGIFKRDCSERYRYILEHNYDFKFRGNIFREGYNDRILSKKDQLQTLIKYILDNPRRLYLRQEFPEYFRTNLILKVGDIEFSIFGNPLLLEHPCRQAVRFSSKYAREEWVEKQRILDETIRNDGVLVSPFYHREEKNYLEKALQSETRLIIICDNGFPPRWKPEKRFIDHCARGRMLFVGPADYSITHQSITRERCLQQNEDASLIARLCPGEYSLRRR